MIKHKYQICNIFHKEEESGPNSHHELRMRDRKKERKRDDK